MKKERIKYGLVYLISIILFALVAKFSGAHKITENTDIILVSQYFIEGMTKWYVLLVGVVAEAIIIKLFFKETIFGSVSVSLIMNAVSTILGFVTLYIAGLIVEVLFLAFPFGSFHVIHWIGNFFVIILMNACLEGLMAKWIFKYKFRKSYWKLCAANAVSLTICFLLNTYWIENMFFTM